MSQNVTFHKGKFPICLKGKDLQQREVEDVKFLMFLS